jgi:hypothetical protein
LLPGTSFNAFRNSKRVLRGSVSSRQLLTKPFSPRRKRLKTSPLNAIIPFRDTAGMRQKRAGKHRWCQRLRQPEGECSIGDRRGVVNRQPRRACGGGEESPVGQMRGHVDHTHHDECQG